MKNLKKKIFKLSLLIITLSPFFTSEAQNAKEDFKKANLIVVQENELSFDINYNFYCSKNDVSPIESNKASYSKLNNSYYTFSFGVETINSNNLLLMVNIKQRTITIRESKKILPFSDINDKIQKTLKYCKKTEYKEEQKEKIYILSIINFGLDKIEIHLRKEDGFLTKVVFFHNEEISTIKNGKKKKCGNGKTEVEFCNIKKLLTIENKKFIINNYVKKQKNGTFKAISPYKDYKIIDIRKNKK